MMQKKKLPILPKATSVWLIENTTLTFRQIADFTGIHELEIKSIADGESAIGIMGYDPILSKQLTKDEIARCSLDPNASLSLIENTVYSSSKKSKNAKYTAIARRRDKPDAIYWLIKNLPTISDSQISKLIGTTKATIATIRDKTHWNMKNIIPRDPVLLGICSQIEIDRMSDLLRSLDDKNNSVKNQAQQVKE